MTFSANFTAIDFETANRRPDSACQLGAVVVRGGEIVEERMWMIRPDPFFFSAGNIRIHGIRPGDVDHEPNFADVWPEVEPYVTDDCLIAHNAGFDINVLVSCLRRHQLEVPELNFSCTRLIAKQAWPSRPRYGLKPLSNWLGVEFKHHDALEDSIACARVLLAAGITKEASSLEELEKTLRLQRGKAGEWGIQQATKIRRRHGRSQNRSDSRPKRRTRRPESRQLSLPLNPFDEQAMTREPSMDYRREASPAPIGGNLQRVLIRAEFVQPLRGRCIVLQGKLKTMTTDQVIDVTTRSGGVFQSAVDESTNCIVLGAENTDEINGPGDAPPLDGAMEVLSESEFLGMIGLQ
ncbi:MAG: exonuclease domain-containing protein [Planctomycetota bacterium]